MQKINYLLFSEDINRIIKNEQLTPVKKGCMRFILVLNHIVRTAEYKT